MNQTIQTTLLRLLLTRPRTNKTIILKISRRRIKRISQYFRHSSTPNLHTTVNLTRTNILLSTISALSRRPVNVKMSLSSLTNRTSILTQSSLRRVTLTGIRTYRIATPPIQTE